MEQRQRLVDIFVNSIYVYDDHAVITFNYHDGTKTISLQEIEDTGLGSSLSLFGAPQFVRELLCLQGFLAVLGSKRDDRKHNFCNIADIENLLISEKH